MFVEILKKKKWKQFAKSVLGTVKFRFPCVLFSFRRNYFLFPFFIFRQQLFTFCVRLIDQKKEILKT